MNLRNACSNAGFVAYAWRFMDINASIANGERRKFRRVFSLVPEEDVVLFKINEGVDFFVAKLGRRKERETGEGSASERARPSRR